jgi:Trk K+ transport system NAD-binding subunit
MRVIIIGGGQVGQALAKRLEDRGENVVIIEEDEVIVEQLRNAGYATVIGDGTDTDVLREAGAENAKIVVAATGDDDANLLVSQLAKSKFSADNIIARANNSNNVEAFEELDVNTISSAMAAAWAIDNEIERPAISHWMTNVGETGDIQEIPVTNPELFDKTVREMGPMLPDACLIALVSKDGRESGQVPTADAVVEEGDYITLMGRQDTVRKGMNLVNPD